MNSIVRLRLLEEVLWENRTLKDLNSSLSVDFWPTGNYSVQGSIKREEGREKDVAQFPVGPT